MRYASARPNHQAASSHSGAPPPATSRSNARASSPPSLPSSHPKRRPSALCPRLLALATRQHGVFTHTQATSLGMSRTSLSRAHRAGRCSRILPGVYRVAGAEPTFHSRLMAACLWAGPEAVVSHASAARLYKLDGFDHELVVLTVPGKPRRPGPVQCLHSGRVESSDRRTVSGIPVTSVARTLVDVSAGKSVAEASEPLDCAWRKLLIRLDYVAHRLKSLARKGRSGVRALRAALAHCYRRGKPLGSILEVRTWYLLKKAKLPDPECGLSFEPPQGQPGAIDLAFPERSLALECDGFLHHGLTRELFEATERRASQLTALGWRVQRITARMLKEEPEAVVERIRLALATPRVLWNPLPMS